MFTLKIHSAPTTLPQFYPACHPSGPSCNQAHHPTLLADDQSIYPALPAIVSCQVLPACPPSIPALPPQARQRHE